MRGDACAAPTSPCESSLELELESDACETRWNDAERTIERGARAPLQVLRRVAVEDVVEVEEAGDQSPAREADLLLNPNVGDDDVVLAPRAERLREEANASVAQVRRERAPERKSLLIPEHRRH